MTVYGKIDRLTGTAALEAARKMMDAQGLAQPPVPDKMVGSLQQWAPNLFATCELPNGLYAIDRLVDNTAAGSLDEFIALGFDGHGIQSWAFHFALIEGSLAVFLQLQWGGVYVEPQIARGRIEGCLGFVSMLRRDMAMAAAAGKLDPAKRLIVLETDFTRPRWSWLNMGGPAPSSWNTDPPVLFKALMSVQDLLE